MTFTTEKRQERYEKAVTRRAKIKKIRALQAANRVAKLREKSGI
jgi:hypothetical protein